MSEKKILLLISFLEPWSMGTESGAPSLYETIRGYVAAGWHVHYLTARKRPMGGGSHERDIDINIINVTVHRFSLPAPFAFAGSRIQGKMDRIFYFPRYAAKAIQELLECLKPTLIYAYEEGAILAVSRLRKNADDYKVLHRFQGTILGSLYQSLPHVFRKMESWMALRKQADLYVMADDGTLGNRALSHWNSHVTADNLLFIRNGVDPSIRNQDVDKSDTLEYFSASKNHPVLLMVSRLAGWKRIDRGIHLLADLKEEYPNIKLIVVGDGECRNDLINYAEKTGVTNKVLFASSQTRAKVTSLMKSCDIFLSLYDISNCGNPLFEALMCGIPIITLDNGTTSSVIKDRFNGRLLDPDDRFGLCEATKELLESEQLREKLSEGGQAWVESNMLSWEQRMQKEVSWVEAFIRD